MNRENEFISIKDILDTFNLARQKLIKDFKNKNREIYLAMFRYENHPELMKLSIENYFTSWINFHLSVWSKKHPDTPNELFYHAIKRLLLEIFPNACEVDSRNYVFISRLISSKVEFINNLIIKGELDDEKYNTLLLEYEKDKALFERKINRLERGDSQ